MGSATTLARASTTAALDAATGVDLGVAGDLFAAARAIGGSSQLGSALADSAAAPGARAKVVTDVFGAVLSPVSVGLLSAVVQQRWSRPADLIEAIEETAVRAAAIAQPEADVEGDLFRFSRAVAENGDLELALGSRMGDESAKGELVTRLLDGRAAASSTLIASSLVQQSRDRRVRTLLQWAMRLVAEQRGRAVATVVSATPLSDAQVERLRAALAARYGTEVALNTRIDPTVLGGLRVQIADDVIDASISTRLADLRQRLAG
ncbi:F0F1 ATP synthase subunit delta [Microbacterium sp. P06]|uniref:F0F1 ATP synthase subunit delta n=1 Tax=unclassified Microbacterium TaxID=2609290 RepID=UPI003746315D